MAEMFQEYADSRGVAVRVDRQQGVIRGVKILGLQSRNGRVYRPEALVEAAPLYEGAKVNVNHAAAGDGARLPGPDRRDSFRGVAVRRSVCRPGLQSQARLGRAIAVGRGACPGKRGLLAQRRSARGAARIAWWSRRSCEWKAWTSWPTPPRRAGCSSRPRRGQPARSTPPRSAWPRPRSTTCGGIGPNWPRRWPPNARPRPSGSKKRSVASARPRPSVLGASELRGAPRVRSARSRLGRRPGAVAGQRRVPGNALGRSRRRSDAPAGG